MSSREIRILDSIVSFDEARAANADIRIVPKNADPAPVASASQRERPGAAFDPVALAGAPVSDPAHPGMIDLDARRTADAPTVGDGSALPPNMRESPVASARRPVDSNPAELREAPSRQSWFSGPRDLPAAACLSPAPIAAPGQSVERHDPTCFTVEPRSAVAVGSSEQARLACPVPELTGNDGNSFGVAVAGTNYSSGPFQMPNTEEKAAIAGAESSPAIATAPKPGTVVPPPNPSGTPAAQQAGTMFFDGHQPENAGFAERRMADREISASPASGFREASSSQILPPQPQPETVVNRASLTTPAPGEVSLPSATRMDRLAELVSVEATILRQFKPGALTAVVRPDADSEVRIELRLLRGQVEARAVIERGDAQAFAAGWEELQITLRPQGVNLLPLVESAAGRDTVSDGSLGDPHGELADDRHRRGRETAAPSWSQGGLSEMLKPAVTVIAGRVVPATGGTRHLLESWA